MLLKYNLEISNEVIRTNLKRLLNQTFKLLCNWEEAVDWEKPLTTVIEELVGMSRLFLDTDSQKIFFSLICKMEGLFIYSSMDDKDFFIFRKSIFECLGLINELIKICQ